MAIQDINPLIQEMLDKTVYDKDICSFIRKILEEEREYMGKKGKLRKYEEILAEYVRMDE